MKKWKSLVASLREAQPISIPRYYLTGIPDKVQAYSLCGYCDASVSAYAAVVYLMIETDSGCFLRFIASKTRVAPTQTQTIPRLELLSALLLARLIDNIAKSLDTQLPLSQPRCFTDSMVTFYWIQGVEKEWKLFVQNRVNEIRKLVPVDCWNQRATQLIFRPEVSHHWNFQSTCCGDTLMQKSLQCQKKMQCQKNVLLK